MRQVATVAALAALAALAMSAGGAMAQGGPTGPNPSPEPLGRPGVSYVKTKMALYAYAAPTESSAVLDEVVGDTVLPTTGCANGWCRIVLARAKPTYIQQNLVEPVIPHR